MNSLPVSTLYASNNKPVYSVEFFPPKDPKFLDATKLKIKDFCDLPVDYMTVTYGAGGTNKGLSFELLTYIHQELNKIVVSHLTCVGNDKNDICTVLEFLKKAGVQNILALRGDLPLNSTFNYEGNEEHFFEGASDLTKFIKEKYSFCLLTAGYPETHRLAKSSKDDILYLKQKVDSGAEVILTQLFFDSDIYFRFVDQCRSAGINVPIVPGILPIRDYKQLTKFTTMCGATVPKRVISDLEKIQSNSSDVIRYGTAHSIELCKRLISNGAPGIHFYSLNHSDQVKEILKEIC